MPAAKAKTHTEIPVFVTTSHKGVFFGYMNGDQDIASILAEGGSKAITLTSAQMCVSWSSDVGGVVGLGASGPSKGCRVSPAVPKLTLSGVTMVVEVTEAAEAAWKGRPWS